MSNYDDDFDENDISWAEPLTENDLKIELINRGLSIDGERMDLIRKIQEYDYNAFKLNTNSMNETAICEKDEDIFVWSEEDKDVNKFSVDILRDRDMLEVVWCGDTILVPCKDEVLYDLKKFKRKQDIIAYPVFASDLYHKDIIPLVQSALNVSLQVDESEDRTVKGFLRMKFESAMETQQAVAHLNSLANGKRQINVKYFTDSKNEDTILKEIKGNVANSIQDNLLKRLLFVSHLPNGVSEETIRDLFLDAVKIYTLHEFDNDENICRAYLEFSSEEKCLQGAIDYKDVSLYGQRIYVIRCISEKKNNFGILKETLRTYWLDQIKCVEDAKLKQNNTSDEIDELNMKLARFKQRISKDNEKRRYLCLPVADDENFPSTELKLPLDCIKANGTSDKVVSKRMELQPYSNRQQPYARRLPVASHDYNGRIPHNGYRPIRRPVDRSGKISQPYNWQNGSNNFVEQLSELVGVLTNNLPMDAFLSPSNKNTFGRSGRRYEPECSEEYEKRPINRMQSHYAKSNPMKHRRRF